MEKTTVKERATLLNKIADIIDAHTDELALIETLDNGKPIRETKNIDVPLSAAHFRYFAGCILAEEGSATMLDNTTMSIILREPIGVVGQIVPWNFPFLMAAWKLAPVLASGCCTVLKPSKTTSLSVLYFADLIKDILPPGVFNVITGAGSKAGQYMLDHKGFCKLAFTGSTEVGLSVAKAAAENSFRPRSSSAANPRTSSSRTATSSKHMMVPSSASSSIRDRSAALVRASSFRRTSMTNS